MPPPSSDLSWPKETRMDATSVVVKMEKPQNWSTGGALLSNSSSAAELKVPLNLGSAEKEGKGKNSKQIRWIMFLRAHQAAGCVAWSAQTFLSVLSTINRRLILRQGVEIEDQRQRGKLYTILRVLLASTVFMLGFELVAHIKGWHFQPQIYIPGSEDVRGILQSTYVGWIYIRENYLGPPLQSLANVCIILFLIQSLDRVTQCLGCVYIKLKGIRPVPKVLSLDTGDEEQPNAG